MHEGRSSTGAPDAQVVEHEALQALRSSNELLRSVFLTVAEGLVVHDAAGAIIECNPSAERILGLTSAELRGRTSVDPCWRAVHEDGSPFPGADHPSSVTLRTGQPLSDVIMGVHKPDGALTWISIRSEPLRERPGDPPLAVLTTLRDITAEHLRATEARLEAAAVQQGLEAGAVGLWAYDVDAGASYLDSRGLKLLGISEATQEAAIRRILDALHPEDLQRLRSDVLRHLRDELPGLDIEVRVLGPDGAYVWFAVQGRLVAPGLPRRIAGTLRSAAVVRAAHERQLAEARLKDLDGRSNEIELVMRPDGTLVHANDRACDAYGLTREELLRLNVRDLRAPTTLVAIDGQLSNARQGGTRFETEHRRRDGSSFPVEVSSRPFTAGGETYLHSLVRDLTDRRRAEGDRRLFAGLVEHMHDAVVVSDLQLRITAWSGAAEQIFGWTEAEALGRLVPELLDPEFPSRGVSERLEAMARSLPLRSRQRARRRDGSPVDVDTIIDALRDHDGQPCAYFAVHRDRSAQQAAEARAREAEERLALAMRHARTAFFDWDLDHGTMVHDERHYTWAGVPSVIRGDVPALAEALAAPEDRARFIEGVRECDRRDDLTIEHRRPDRETWVRAHGLVTERHPDGRARRIVGTVEDLTDRRELEARARRAERLDTLGTLVAGLSHEINNPLVVAITNLQVLAGVLEIAPEAVREAWRDARGSALDDAAELVRDALDAGWRMRDIVSDLRAFSPHERGLLERADVGRVVTHALGLARDALARCASVTVDVTDLPPVDARSGELLEVFVNLLGNAALATGARPNHVKITGRTGAEGTVTIEIHDTGVGIAPEILPRIFDPFFTTRPVGAGRGLGLSASLGILRSLGGDLSVTSTEGDGTRALLTLPINR